MDGGKDSAVGREAVTDGDEAQGKIATAAESTFCTDCGGGPVVREFASGLIRLCRKCESEYGNTEMVQID